MPRHDPRPNKEPYHDSRPNTGRRPQCQKPVREGNNTAPCGNPLNAAGKCPTHGSNIK